MCIVIITANTKQITRNHWFQPTCTEERYHFYFPKEISPKKYFFTNNSHKLACLLYRYTTHWNNKHVVTKVPACSRASSRALRIDSFAGVTYPTHRLVCMSCQILRLDPYSRASNIKEAPGLVLVTLLRRISWYHQILIKSA